jgi:hypothetical protein
VQTPSLLIRWNPMVFNPHGLATIRRPPPCPRYETGARRFRPMTEDCRIAD